MCPSLSKSEDNRPSRDPKWWKRGNGSLVFLPPFPPFSTIIDVKALREDGKTLSGLAAPGRSNRDAQCIRCWGCQAAKPVAWRSAKTGCPVFQTWLTATPTLQVDILASSSTLCYL